MRLLRVERVIVAGEEFLFARCTSHSKPRHASFVIVVRIIANGILGVFQLLEVEEACHRSYALLCVDLLAVSVWLRVPK